MEKTARLPFLVLDFRLDIVDCIGRFNLEGDSLASEGLYKNLHGCSSERDVKGVRNGVTAFMFPSRDLSLI